VVRRRGNGDLILNAPSSGAFGKSGYVAPQTRALSAITQSPDVDQSDFTSSQKMAELLQRHDYQIRSLAQNAKQLQQGVNDATQNPVQQLQQFIADLVVMFNGGEVADLVTNYGDLKYILPAIGALLGLNSGAGYPVNLFQAAQKLFLGYIVPTQQFTDVINTYIGNWSRAFGIDQQFVSDVQELVTALGYLFDGIHNMLPSMSSLLSELGITGRDLGPLGQKLAPVLNLFNGLDFSLYDDITHLVTGAMDTFVVNLTKTINFINEVLRILEAGGDVVNSPLPQITQPFANLVAFLGNVKLAINDFNPLAAAQQWLGRLVLPVSGISNVTPDLQVDSGFDDAASLAAGSAAWDTGGDTAWVHDAGIGRTANGSAKVTANGSAHELLGTVIPVVAGQTINVDAYVSWSGLTATGSPLALQLRTDIATNIAIASVPSPGSSATWTHLSGDYTITDTDISNGVTTVRTKLLVAATATAGHVWFDDAPITRSNLMPQNLIENLVDQIQHLALNGLYNAAAGFENMAAGIATWLTSGGALPSATTLAVSGLTSLATGIGAWLASGGALPSATSLALSGLTGLATGIGTWLGSGGALPSATTLAVSGLTSLATGIGTWLASGGALPSATSLAVSGLTGLATGIQAWLASSGALPSAVTIAATALTSGAIPSGVTMAANYLTGLATGIQTWITSGGALPSATTLAVSGLTSLATGIGSWLGSGGALPGATTLAVSGITSLASGIQSWLGSGGALPAATSLAATGLTGLGAGIGTWLGAGGALPAATTLAVSGLTSLATGVGTWLASGGALPAATTLAVSGLTSLATGIQSWLSSGGALPGATTLAVGGLSGLGTGVGAWLAAGGPLSTGFIPNITLAMSTDLQALTNAVYNALNNLSSTGITVTQAFNSFGAFVTGIYNKITGSAASAASYTQVNAAIAAQATAVAGASVVAATAQASIAGVSQKGTNATENFSTYANGTPAGFTTISGSPNVSSGLLTGAFQILYNTTTQGVFQAVSATWTNTPTNAYLWARANTSGVDSVEAIYGNGNWSISIYNAFGSNLGWQVADPFTPNATYTLLAGVGKNPYAFRLLKNGIGILDADMSSGVTISGSAYWPGTDDSHLSCGVGQTSDGNLLSFHVYDTATNYALIRGQNSSQTTSVTIPTHAVGDLIVIYAFNGSSTTTPSTPTASGTVPAWSTIDGTTGANSCASKTAFFVATANNHTSGTWTNASAMIAVVIRGQNPLEVVGATTVRTPIGVHAEAGGNNGVPAAAAQTLQRTDGSSLILKFLGSVNVNTGGWGGASSGFIKRVAGGTGASACFESKQVSTSDSLCNNNLPAGSSSNWRAATVEILADPLTDLSRVNLQAGTTGTISGGAYMNATSSTEDYVVFNVPANGKCTVTLDHVLNGATVDPSAIKMGYTMSGANTASAADEYSTGANNRQNGGGVGVSHIRKGLNPGWTVFKPQFAATAGNMSSIQRQIAVDI
jgi:hypothetical protein